VAVRRDDRGRLSDMVRMGWHQQSAVRVGQPRVRSDRGRRPSERRSRALAATCVSVRERDRRRGVNRLILERPWVRRVAGFGLVTPAQRVWSRACQRPGRCSVASTLPWVSSASTATTDGNGPGTLEANRFWLTGAEMTVLPEASIPVTVATPSAAKPANWISGGKIITGRAGEGKVPFRSQPTPLATFDSLANQ